MNVRNIGGLSSWQWNGGSKVHWGGIGWYGADGRERFCEEKTVPGSDVAFLAVAIVGVVVGDVYRLCGQREEG